MHFVKLTALLDGKPLFANMAVVMEIAPHGTGSRLEFLSTGSRNYALVKESPEVVLALLPENAKHMDLWEELGAPRRKVKVAVA